MDAKSNLDNFLPNFSGISQVRCIVIRGSDSALHLGSKIMRSFTFLTVSSIMEGISSLTYIIYSFSKVK